uniref:Uncharacterized protein n=1 Tax=Amphora coffeiformis TaxID=265554 RepID=A0A7S3P545_9STRA|eukprot:scaffold3034_cov173-Amphora_coffeaeformis.AAC.2
MVRLYRSSSPGKRRFIENDSDISATRSPICGASVLGKIIQGKSSNTNFDNNTNPSQSSSSWNRREPEYVSIHSKKGGFQQGSVSYEPIGSSVHSTYSSGRKSPESTESSTSSSHSHEDDDKESENRPAPYVLQFEPQLEQVQKVDSSNASDEVDREQLRMDRLQAWMEQQQKSGPNSQSQKNSSNGLQLPTPGISIRNRSHFWSANLPVVTEERSFEVEDSSIASSPSLKEEGEQTRNVRTYSSPERNEMLLAMRQLVLKQQAALSEMAEENKHYRRELHECRQLLQLAKEAYTKKHRQIENFMVEKESADAEVLWLREEVKTLRDEVRKHQEAKNTWTSSKSSEEVEERLRKARAETPEKRKSIQTKCEEATPAPSPVTSPVQSPVRDNLKLKSILPEINYLSDEADSDGEDLMKEFRDLRATLEGAGISTNEVEQRLQMQRMAVSTTDSESRDDGNLSPEMWLQDEDDKAPDDEMRDWARSRSPAPSKRSQEFTRGRVHQPPSNQVVPRERSRTPSEISAAGSSVSATSSVASQRSREEVALFKSRLGAIQKKREQRKHIEENVGSRSGRVRFT